GDADTSSSDRADAETLIADPMIGGDGRGQTAPTATPAGDPRGTSDRRAPVGSAGAGGALSDRPGPPRPVSAGAPRAAPSSHDPRGCPLARAHPRHRRSGLEAVAVAPASSWAGDAR